MKRRFIFLLWLACLLVIVAGSSAITAQRRAKNIILFLGDAAGIPTLLEGR